MCVNQSLNFDRSTSNSGLESADSKKAEAISSCRLPPRTSRNSMNPFKTIRRVDGNASRFQLRIGPSRIRGLGVFAEETIPPRHKVIEYTGEKIHRAALEKRLRRIFRRHGWMPRYIFCLNKNWYVDGQKGGCGAERVNHCCDPNLVTRKINGRIFYFSRRRIARGQELTIDYRYRPESARKVCCCGSPKCRGTINLRGKESR